MRWQVPVLVGAAALATPFPAPAAREQPRGIDCARAARPLEKLTCGDPQLREYDSRIAAAYQRALASLGGTIAAYVKADQRGWLAEYRTIEHPEGEIDPPCALTDRACIRDFVHQRVDAIESGAYVYSGVWQRADGAKLLIYPRAGNSYSLRVFAPGTGRTQAILDDGAGRASLWDGPATLVARMGDGNGLPLAKGTCTVRISLAPLEARLTAQGNCTRPGWDGSYRRLTGATLRDYENALE